MPALSPASPDLSRPFLLLLLLVALSAGGAHQSPSAHSSAALTEWRSARASYYAASDPRDTVGGACGYGDLGKEGYGMGTAGLSSALFDRGAACGGCYEVRCVEELRYCLPGTSIVLTATNFCAPNYGFPSDAGGLCNPPNHHIVIPIAAFEKIAIWKAGVMPIQYRRLFLLCPTAEAAVQVPEEEIERVIESLGLQRKRAKMIKRFWCEYLGDDWTHVTQLHGIGNFQERDGRFLKFNMLERNYVDTEAIRGWFGRVSVETQPLYQNYPCLAVYAQRMCSDASDDELNPEWTLRHPLQRSMRRVHNGRPPLEHHPQRPGLPPRPLRAEGVRRAKKGQSEEEECSASTAV